MVRQMAKSKAIEWERHPDIKIKIKPLDDVIQKKTNTVSVTPLNRRKYENHTAIVILGLHEAVGNYILVKEGVRIWTCNIDGRGAVSSIGLPEVDVTVIVREGKKAI
jgi:hypothetical protein